MSKTKLNTLLMYLFTNLATLYYLSHAAFLFTGTVQCNMLSYQYNIISILASKKHEWTQTSRNFTFCDGMDLAGQWDSFLSLSLSFSLSLFQAVSLCVFLFVRVSLCLGKRQRCRPEIIRAAIKLKFKTRVSE